MSNQEAPMSHLLPPEPKEVLPTETEVAAKKVAMPTKAEMKEKAQQSETWTFSFQPKMDNGDFNPAYPAGVFTSTVPTIRMRRDIGIRRAAFNMAIPVAALDKLTNDLNIMLARFSVCLDTAQNPEAHWSRDLEEIEDEDVLYQLFEEVDQHAGTFRKRREITG